MAVALLLAVPGLPTGTHSAFADMHQITPPPFDTPKPVLVPTPVSTSSETPKPRRGHHAPAPAATATASPDEVPTNPAFSTLDGTWEVQRQYADRTTYSYFTLTQKGTTLNGLWHIAKQQYPMTGSYDGHSVTLVATLPDGEVDFAGYVLSGADMVGTLDPKAPSLGAQTAFTAEHRAKSKLELQSIPIGLPGAGPGAGPQL